MSSIYPISHVCLSLLGCKPPQCVHSSMLYLKHCPTSNRLAVYLSSEQSYLTPSRSLIDGCYSLLFLLLLLFYYEKGGRLQVNMPSQSSTVGSSSTVTPSFRSNASLAHLFSRYSPAYSPVLLASALLRSLQNQWDLKGNDFSEQQ